MAEKKQEKACGNSLKDYQVLQVDVGCNTSNLDEIADAIVALLEKYYEEQCAKL